MEVRRFIGKDYEETLKEILDQYETPAENLIISKKTIKTGIFQSDKVEISVIPIDDIAGYIKNYLTDLYKIINITTDYQVTYKNKQINIKINSDDNSIIIGKNGKNLSALEHIIRQMIRKFIDNPPYISLDVGDYKDLQIAHLQKMSKRVATEVLETGIPVELDNMNAYERLIVHNSIKDIDGVYTESVGEEPNRHIIIKISK